MTHRCAEDPDALTFAVGPAHFDAAVLVLAAASVFAGGGVIVV